MAGKPRILDLLAPVVAVAVFSLLLLSGAAGRIRDASYDLFSRIRPSPAAAREILLVDVDDAAVASGGAWPWGRGVLADGLAVMKEMEAETAVFTFPFPRQSAPGIDASALQSGIPEAFDREFSRIEENIQSLFDAIRRGSVPSRDSPRYVSELIGLVAGGKVRLLEEVTGIERDDDVHLGQASQFFGRTYMPLELIPAPDPAVARDLAERAVSLMALADVEVTHDSSLRTPAIRPPVLPILRGARGGGFTDLPPDADGVYRRAAPTAEYRGSHFAQIAFAAALSRQGDPRVVLEENSLTLHYPAAKGQPARTLAIPLGRDGRLLLDWPRVAEGDGFRHLSWAALLRQSKLETELLSSLRDMERSGYLSYHRSEASLLDLYQYAEGLFGDMLAGGSTERVSEWRAARERFFDAVRGFLEGDAESRILSDAEKALSSEKLSDEEKRGIREVRDRVPMAFTYARGTFSDLDRVRSSLRESLRGSLCIVSLAASPQAVSGRTPAGRPATEGLASAALANQVLSGRVLRELPAWALVVLAAAFSLLAAAAAFRLGPLGCTFVAAAFAAAVPALLCACFLLAGIYADPLAPTGSPVCTAAVLALIRSRRNRVGTRQGRADRKPTLRVTAPEPSMQRVAVLEAGWKPPAFVPGTADPRTLLENSRSRLASLEESVGKRNGTVAHAGADVLVALFAASSDRRDLAERACRTALALQEAEGGLLPGLRIGIDAGDCAVGCLEGPGTRGLAVLGEPSELASRLASLNGRCGTSILVTSTVREAAGEDLVFRMMHRVRIAGSGRDVRLYQPLGEKGRMDGKILDAMEIFREGVRRFEENDWKKAEGIFREVLSLKAGDGPAAFFIERCRELAARPEGSRWDGVFTLPAR